MSDQIEILAKAGKLSKIESLSPLALQQLRALAFRVNEGGMRQRASSLAQLKVSEEISDIRFKLEPMIEQRRKYERFGAKKAAEVAELTSQIAPMERRLDSLQGQKDVILASKSEIDTNLSPERMLMGQLLSYMRVSRMEDLFPDLPSDASTVFSR